jgi:DNA-binding CsgD family transcriptional regulator
VSVIRKPWVMLGAEVLGELDRTVDDLARYRGDRFEQFDCIRLTMARLTKVDAFYVAEFVGDNSVHFHHQYDEDSFDLPGSLPVLPGRVAHWVRANRRPYVYASDDGKLLHAGARFGQLEKTSRDAVVCPVFSGSPDRRVSGLVSVQTYTPNTYDADTVAALEYLADALGAQIAHEDLAAERSRRLSAANSPFQPAEDVLGEVLLALNKFHVRLDKSLSRSAKPGYDVGTDLRALRREIERLQSGLWARELYQQRLVAEKLESLTPRQRELVKLLAELSAKEGSTPSNAELATRMKITEATVKSHMNVALRVLGVSDRAEAAAAVRRLTGHRVYR